MKDFFLYLFVGIGICTFWLAIFFMAWFVGNEVFK
jgi:hypothetical protein